MHHIAAIRKRCLSCVGGWVEFTTPWGTHRGIVEQVTDTAVLVRVPRQYAPALASAKMGPQTADGKPLDVSLAQWYGYGYGYGYGPGWGWWWGGWWWWWLAFAWIWALAFLWW